MPDDLADLAYQVRARLEARELGLEYVELEMPPPDHLEPGCPYRGIVLLGPLEQAKRALYEGFGSLAPAIARMRGSGFPRRAWHWLARHHRTILRPVTS